MRPVEIELSGVLVDSEKAYFGGSFSFLERIKMGGIGSPKIVYEQGIPEFDALDRGVENEVSFASFELLKNGLILRVNRNQRLACVGLKISDIDRIQVTAYRIEIPSSRWSRNRTRIVHRGVLEIIGKDQSASRFSIFTQNFEPLLKFLQKDQLIDKLDYKISDDPPEKDNESLLDFLAGLN